MRNIQGQGYVGLGHGNGAPRDNSDDTLEGEEEGSGRAIAEDAEGGEVGSPILQYSIALTDTERSTTILVRS